MTLKDCRWISLPKITDPRGSLCFAESAEQAPFDIKRVYYLFDIPEGEMRGGHGHKSLEQVFIAIHGSFSVTLDDGFSRNEYFLDRPDAALYVAPMMWREVRAFSFDAVCLVLASQRYDASDYILDYREYVRAVQCAS